MGPISMIQQFLPHLKKMNVAAIQGMQKNKLEIVSGVALALKIFSRLAPAFIFR